MHHVPQQLGWADYDIQFRLSRAKNHLINWETMEAEKRLIYMGQLSVSDRKPASSLHQHKWCYDFNVRGSILKRDKYVNIHILVLHVVKTKPSITCYNNQTTHNTTCSMSEKVSHSVSQQGNVNPQVFGDYVTPQSMFLHQPLCYKTI